MKPHSTSLDPGPLLNSQSRPRPRRNTRLVRKGPAQSRPQKGLNRSGPWPVIGPDSSALTSGAANLSQRTASAWLVTDSVALAGNGWTKCGPGLATDDVSERTMSGTSTGSAGVYAGQKPSPASSIVYDRWQMADLECVSQFQQ
jgi:hypothetical protein